VHSLDPIVLTVGLCVKNSERTVKSALESLMRQNYPHGEMEIIVVDGQSKDKTLEIVRNMQETVNIRISIFSDGGKGLGKASQIVVDRALGRHIIFISGDIVLPKNFLLKQLNLMERNHSIGAVIPEFEYTKRQKNLMADIQNLLLGAVNTNLSNGTVFRKEALDEVHGFDTRIKGASEDRELILRLRLAGWKVTRNSEARFSQMRDETSKDIYSRYFWYGYGDHFTHHKHRSSIKVPYWLPPIYFAWGLKISLKAYKKYSRKRLFLIPFFCLFASVDWCLGFVSAHLDDYGHLLTAN